MLSYTSSRNPCLSRKFRLEKLQHEGACWVETSKLQLWLQSWHILDSVEISTVKKERGWGAEFMRGYACLFQGLYVWCVGGVWAVWCVCGVCLCQQWICLNAWMYPHIGTQQNDACNGRTTAGDLGVPPVHVCVCWAIISSVGQSMVSWETSRETSSG